QRELLLALLRSSNDFEVVGTASNGKEAIAEAQRLRPNVIAMDNHLPILDGYEATRQIMRECPTPIVLISSQRDTAQRSIEALAAGALTVVSKPGGRAPADERATFLTTLRLMADVHVVTRHSTRPLTADQRSPDGARHGSPVAGSWDAAQSRRRPPPVPKILAIAASTGGPAAVQTVLRGLGTGFPLPILVVQHIARGFVPALAEWLNNTLALPVRVAQQGERLHPGQVYLAPEDHHLVSHEPGTAGLRPVAAGDRFCPSADLLFETAATVYGGAAIGLVLTGMGDDGTRGLLALRAAGAPTLAQDAASCVVYGMPRAAVEAGAVARSEPLALIADAILGLVGGAARGLGVS
ncbi:MAG TPA: chemotaxis-specific protein-glutamate methyltransferase CheB, partial [Roseiflexaceae bacterium]|nr:chemotaxis-specific protein-glutamate methyltransferase CheB [Roseiflexaceae bacterium]